MSDAADHEAKALGWIDPTLWEKEGTNVLQLHAMLQMAQVHATLAIVQVQRKANEQARVANLIALAGAEFTVPDLDYLEVLAEIRKGLGL